ncbi:pathogenesis-related protein 5-like [Durio zibethinus]|uniref:Pathogenesis-related protein 5-like n=1 Tax=Durio zibethinus TaxID=66656 RepID=A0A6P6B6I3_DURZI|nr:pathogenesis-related protein 5-like [Durio zibethinus]
MALIFSTCLFSLLSIFQGISGTTFTVVNKCDHTVWPGILGNTQLDSTGFELPSGGSRSLQAPPGWSGRFWGRTGCTSDQNTGQLTCQTGASPPATLAEFTIGSGTQDFYDVSLVDGYNLPMIVEPSGGSGTCLSTGCINDVNRQCPTELQVGSGDACKSACEAFETPQYCCSGAYATPNTCKPSVYSEMFKAACPRSYSYAYDDATSTFTCTGADYAITFCPSSTSKKSATNTTPTTPGTTATTTGTTGTTSTTYGSITGSGEVPTGDNTSWLPDFFMGESSRTLSPAVFHTTLLASAISFLFLSRFYS